jgi:hypothetical protein
MIFLTIMLPIGLYRTHSDFKKEKTFRVSILGKVNIYEGEKAKKFLYLSYGFQCFIIIMLWILFSKYFK